MELYLLRHAEWERLYNCTAFNIDAIPLEQRAGQFVPEAWALIVLCSIFYPLYIPCLLSIWKQHRAGGNSCYTILLYIGCMDIAILWIIGYLHAVLSLQGAVYCSYPLLIYWCGICVLLFWIAETSADMVGSISLLLLGLRV